MRFSIVYFSAAGHTLKVIRHIAEQMGGIDRAVDLSDPFLKQTSFAKDDRVIVACPVYGGRIPSLVAERLQKITFDGTRVVTVVTYGNRAYEDALAAATEQIALLSHQTRDKERPDLDALRTLLETQNAEADQCALEWGALKQRVKDLTKTAAMIQTEIADIAQTEAEYGKLARIYRYCAGNNPAKTPLSNFVLGLLLDDVMEEASRYLSRLSGDRYALVRVDAAGGNAYRGLDIEVMDAYKGGRRKVGTLSGGELFLASLSLAFGLAQVVQSYAGGIQLDSLFIDEGFGTLDGDTLDAAMAALGEIEKSGRMVGLISHVGELKTRIFARIEVYPGENGAKLKVIG